MSHSDPSTLLYVPMGLQALVKWDESRNGALWDRRPKVYANLNALQTPDPTPIGPTNSAMPDKGIHLYWTLPKALTSAIVSPSIDEETNIATSAASPKDAPPASLSNTTFPYVPNRWLVMRVAHIENADPTLSAWVLNSDELDDTHGRAAFVNPFNLESAPFARPMPLGVKRTLEEWQALHAANAVPAAAESFLTAVGPGDMTFSAFTPGNENVFSFHDDLSDVENRAQMLDYCLVGWFSDPEIDPLSPEYTLRDQALNWALVDDPATLTELGYTGSDPLYMDSNLGWAAAFEQNAAPTQTIVHCALSGVGWNPDETTPNPPDLIQPDAVPEGVKVAVADTLPDAMAALIADSVAEQATGPNSKATLEKVFAALQTKLLRMLDDPSGQSVLADALKHKAYDRHGGGYKWEILVQETDTTKAGPAPLSADQKASLANLNARQQKLNEAIDVLWSMKWRLYTLWWSENSIPLAAEPHNEPQRSTFEAVRSYYADQAEAGTGVTDSYLEAVKAQMQTVVTLVKDLPSSAWDSGEQTLIDYTQHMLGCAGYVLRAMPLPRFYEQSDPVVLIGGASALNSPQPNIVLTQTGTQLAQTLQANGLTIDIGDGIPADPNAVLAALQAAKTQIAADPDHPMPLGMQIWQQPWAPLYLDWQVEYFYAYKVTENGLPAPNANGQFEFDMDSWAFDGTEYQWIGSGVGETPASSLQPNLSRHYSGRVPLMPHASRNLMAQLQSYLEDYPEISIEQADLDAIANWPIMAQSLSGLTAGLIMQDLRTNVAPGNSVAAFVKGQDIGVPNPGLVPDLTEGDTGAPYFFPIRGGFSRISGLRMIDSFGQSLDLMAANNGSTVAATPFIKPILPTALQPACAVDQEDQGLFTSAPRLNHPARLDLRFVNASDDSCQTGYAPNSNPVAGFLLANHLDQSISVYDADGGALGEVQCFVQDADVKTVQWLSAPGGSSAPSAPLEKPSLDNDILNDVVSSVFGLQDNGAAFYDLLATIDQTSWTIDPKFARTDQGLSVMVGYPLAVVRANVQLQLKGLPHANLGYSQLLDPNTGALFQDTGGIFEQDFPVRFGDLELRKDGVIGYYTDAEANTYAQFFACQRPASVTSAYVRQADTSNYPRVCPAPTPSDPSQNEMDTAGSAYVTLLLDPRANIHLTSGLLPQNHVALPPEYYGSALRNMAATFQVGPVLTDVEAITLPVPAGKKGDWLWVHPTGTNAGDWQEDPLVQSNDRAKLSDRPPILQDGWFKLNPSNEDTEV